MTFAVKEENVAMYQLMLLLRGNASNLPTQVKRTYNGIASHLSSNDVSSIISTMLVKGYLEENICKTSKQGGLWSAKLKVWSLFELLTIRLEATGRKAFSKRTNSWFTCSKCKGVY